ncbi:DUF4097 domain-containing protein [Macrococcus capreoli]|uniref:DUF4097 domain-containing protein n=1 Tax=Macrococcus capreoli TaxID=2982690 RepID=UPI0021D5F608|nr:DUF4097 domain-containing protein [Macrococcus sp. TMW 2.2395]MCU7558202.1 DUF4097 domain-containing protein [Macrococcus sp. TMW 2.2395]
MKKLLIIGLLLFITGCIGMIFTGKSLFKEPDVNESKSFNTNYNNIKVDVQSGEVHFKKSADNNTHIKVSGVNKKGFFKYEVKNNSLIIINNEQVKNRRIFNYGFEQHNEPSIEIAIPNKEFDNITLSTNKSEVNIDQLKAKSINMKSKVGAIYIDELVADKVEFNAGTGELEVDKTNIKNINFDIKLGMITLHALNPDTNMNGKVGSGEADFYYKSAPKNTKFDITTKTGDIEMNDIAGPKSILGNGKYTVKINVELGQVEIDEE